MSERGWLGRMRRNKPQVLGRTYTVQLHRIVQNGTWPHDSRWEIANSWVPISGLSLEEARAWSQRLRMDNRWASATMSPHVTAVCEQTGEPVTEFIP